MHYIPINSVPGLKNRLELNVVLRDKLSYIEGKSVFDELLDTAVTIVNDDFEKYQERGFFEIDMKFDYVFKYTSKEYLSLPNNWNKIN